MVCSYDKTLHTQAYTIVVESSDFEHVVRLILAECVALWGEPEQAVSSGMKGKRETIWLVIAFELA